MVKVNDMPFGNERFYNGETIYKGTAISNDVNCIEVKFETDADITNVIFAVNWLRDKAASVPIVIKMLYIPYSRTDREIPEGNQIFSLKYFAKIINDLHVDKLIVLDPHSPVSEQLLYNMEKMPLDTAIADAIADFQPDYIFYPDKGAYNKYPAILESIDIPYFYGTKQRDLADRGHIIEDSYQLNDAPGLTGKRVMIVDDIVSLGGTAYVAGKALKKAGADKVALYVSHAENGVFYGKLLDGDDEGNRPVDKVYTVATTPLCKEHPNLVVVGQARLGDEIIKTISNMIKQK